MKKSKRYCLNCEEETTFKFNHKKSSHSYCGKCKGNKSIMRINSLNYMGLVKRAKWLRDRNTRRKKETKKVIEFIEERIKFCRKEYGETTEIDSLSNIKTGLEQLWEI